MTNIFLDVLQVSLIPQTDGSEYEEGEILFKQDRATPTSVMIYEMP
jgi:hypothetical protein